MTSLIRLRCPQCGNNDNLDINANIWVRLTDDGTDPDLAASRDHEWDDASHIRCVSCGHSGTVGNFHQNEYMAYFRTTAGPANDIYQAQTPAQALRIAQQVFDTADETLGFTPGDCPELQEIRIAIQDAEEVLVWQTDEYRLQLAAPKLLEALEKQIQITHEIIDAWNNTDKLCGAVQDLINDLDHQSESAHAVLEAHETSDLGIAIDELEESLNTSLEALTQAKGGAA